MMNQLDVRLGSLGRPIRFLVSGTAAAAVYYSVARLIGYWGWSVFAAGFAGYLAAIPAAYLLHRAFTFRSRGAVQAESARFLVGSILGTSLSSALPVLLVRIGLSLSSALAITCVLVPPINYLILSRWTFVHGLEHG
jgi:putative flippase GtrA